MPDEDRRGDRPHELGDPEARRRSSPATIVAFGSASSTAARSSASAGRIARSSPRATSTRAPSSIASSCARTRSRSRTRTSASGAPRIRRRPGGRQDRTVAGAAAEIALQRRLDLRVARPRFLHPERVERHHDPRRAEAALAAVQIDHRLLDRVKRRVPPGEMLDGHDVTEIHRGQQPDAGVDRLVAQSARVPPSHQHRAGAAIALRAALLGAAQARGRAAGNRATCPRPPPPSAGSPAH